MPGTLHFKSKEGYRKYEAYKHIHLAEKEGDKEYKIVIAGKPHKVKHSKQPYVPQMPKLINKEDEHLFNI